MRKKLKKTACFILVAAMLCGQGVCARELQAEGKESDVTEQSEVQPDIEQGEIKEGKTQSDEVRPEENGIEEGETSEESVKEEPDTQNVIEGQSETTKDTLEADAAADGKLIVYEGTQCEFTFKLETSKEYNCECTEWNNSNIFVSGSTYSDDGSFVFYTVCIDGLQEGTAVIQIKEQGTDNVAVTKEVQVKKLPEFPDTYTIYKDTAGKIKINGIDFTDGKRYNACLIQGREETGSEGSRISYLYDSNSIEIGICPTKTGEGIVRVTEANSGAEVELIKFQVKERPDDAVIFEDKNLQKAVEFSEGIDKNEDGYISNSELAEIEKLYLSYGDIGSLKGLEGAANLKELSLRNNQIADITALKGLTNLTSLELSYNLITDIRALEGLTNLTRLSLNNNQITDITAIKSMTNLTFLELDNNQIKDIGALEGLTKLTSLQLGRNQIKNIMPLNKMTSLSNLVLVNNQIIDITPISKLRLESLSISNNPITDIRSLKDNAYLYGLSMDSLNLSNKNQIKELFSTLTGLNFCSINENGLTDEDRLDIWSSSIEKRVNKGDIIRLSKINGLIDMENLTVGTCDEGLHLRMSGNNPYYIAAEKSGKCEFIYKGISKIIEIECDGIDPDQELEESKGKTSFVRDEKNRDKILRENNELWECYPEQKKIKDNVKQYVALGVYEPQEKLRFADLILDMDGSIFRDGDIVSSKDNIKTFDFHYALTEDGTLKDIYNDGTTSLKDVKEWKREIKTGDERGYSGTYVLLQDGTLWYRKDVGKKEKVNQFEKIQEGIAQIWIGDSVFEGEYAKGYLTAEGELFDFSLSKVTQKNVQSVSNIGIYLKSGEFLVASHFGNPDGTERWEQAADFELSEAPVTRSVWSDITQEYEWYRYLVDTKKQVWIEQSEDSGRTWGEPRLVSSQFGKWVYGSEATFVDGSGQYYGDAGNKLTEKEVIESISELVAADGTLYRNGIPILTNVTEANWNYAIRADGTVWDIRGIPRLIVNFQEPGEKLDEQVISEVVQQIQDAAPGDTITADTKYATVLPQEILKAAEGKDVTVQMNMGNYSWSIKGSEITGKNMKDIDLGVSLDTENIPDKVLDKVVGNKECRTLTLAYSGNFGFTGTLNINVGEQYAGSQMEFYYYNKKSGELEKMNENAAKVDEKGYVTLTFTHASDYVAVMESELVKGDVTGDKKVTLSDLQLILQYVSHKTEFTSAQKRMADIDGNGTVTLNDLMKILQYVNHKIDKL